MAVFLGGEGYKVLYIPLDTPLDFGPRTQRTVRLRVVHGEAHGRGSQSAGGNAETGGELKRWSSAPLCLASRWLTSLGRIIAVHHIGHVMWKHDVMHKTGSTYCILRCQQTTEPRPQVTRTENFVKFGRVVCLG